MTHREETLHAECKRLRLEAQDWQHAASAWRWCAMCLFFTLVGIIGSMVWHSF